MPILSGLKPTGANKMMLASVAALSLVLTACEKSSPSIAMVGDKAITQEAFDGYLALKRVDTNKAKDVEQYKKRLLSKEALAQAIEKSSLVQPQKIEAEVEEFRRERLINQYFEKYLSNKVTEEAISNYYASNQDQYASKKAKVSHILIRVNPNISEEERQARYTLAFEAYSKHKAGTDFAELVQAYSEDAVSKKKQGSLGWVSQGTLGQEFSGKVFEELKPGEVSEPFLTPYGYHIVRLDEAPQTVVKPLQQVKGDIRFQLRKAAKDAEIKRLTESVPIK